MKLRLCGIRELAGRLDLVGDARTLSLRASVASVTLMSFHRLNLGACRHARYIQAHEQGCDRAGVHFKLCPQLAYRLRRAPEKLKRYKVFRER